MTIDVGSASVGLHRRKQVERLSAPFCLANDVDIGLAVEEGEQPAAHDLVVVDDQDSRSSHPAPAPSGAIRLRRDSDSHEGSRPGRARDGDPPADLGRTAAHRVQAEVAGMPGGWVEAAPVVANLDDDLPLLRLDPNAGRGRAGVLPDVRRALPARWRTAALPRARTAPVAVPVPARRSSARPRRARPEACLVSAATSPSWTGSRRSSKISERISRCTLLVSSAIVPSDRPTRPEALPPSCTKAFWAVRVCSTVENSA